MLTAKYKLRFTKDKDNIKEERLHLYDKAKHEVYKALKEEPVQVVSASRFDDSPNNSLGWFSGVGFAFNATDAETNQEMADILRGKKKAK